MTHQEFTELLSSIEHVSIFRLTPDEFWRIKATGAMPHEVGEILSIDNEHQRFAGLDDAYTKLRQLGFSGKLEVDG